MRKGLLIGCLALLLLVMLSLFFHLRINTSNSMPIGLYREVQAQIKRGSLVEVCLPDSIAKVGLERSYLAGGRCLNGAEPVIKEVLAVAGNTVELSNENIRVNGKAIRNSKTLTKDRAGRSMQAVSRGHYLLRANELWLYGSHDIASWDSRYYGVISSEFVISVLTPFFIFNG